MYCIENGIDFMDLAGNISINVPGTFVTKAQAQLEQEGQNLGASRAPESTPISER
jgi:hypothetical protein